MKKLILAIALLTCVSAAAQRRVILLIGDGMGLAQVSALMLAAGDEPTSFERATTGGFVKTSSADNRVTDSAAAATAYASGIKTNNTYLGVDADGQPLETILEKAEAAGLSTGLVATTYLEHATPGAFYAHVRDRGEREEISRQLSRAGIEFARGEVDDLAAATREALEVLTTDDDGFFLMVEGSFIDSAGHGGDSERLLVEMSGFERAVGVAFDYADRHPGTLVVVTADHETGGLTIPSGDENFLLPDSGIEFRWSTGGHTGVLVPLFAYGSGAEVFGGVMDNTAVNHRLEEHLTLRAKRRLIFSSP